MGGRAPLPQGHAENDIARSLNWVPEKVPGHRTKPTACGYTEGMETVRKSQEGFSRKKSRRSSVICSDGMTGSELGGAAEDAAPGQ